MYIQHITVSGELGSGKSSVARKLGAANGMKVISTGDLQREMAHEMKLSTLDLNTLADKSGEVDDYLDGLLRDVGSKEEPHVFDSRLAWHFVPSAFKVHLLVDREIAAQRIFAARLSHVERYATIDDARRLVEERYQKERSRFHRKYGVNVSRLRNYDLVLDTSDLTLDEVVGEIQAILQGAPRYPGFSLLISPKRVIPTGDIARTLSSFDANGYNDCEVPLIGYMRPTLFCIRGLSVLSQQIRRGERIAPATLEAEDDEQIVGGINAREYLLKEARLSWIYDWEEAHDFRFSAYPQLQGN